jgi:hypothetical protein
VNISSRLLGKILKNIQLYREAEEIGFDYIVNPDTGELHYVHSTNFQGSHNLEQADLRTFIGLFNVGVIPLHKFQDGTQIPIHDADSGILIGTYTLNKCRHCQFPL